MLSHSSYGSAKNDDSDKVVRATAKVKELAPELAVDGELQLDAAIVPDDRRGEGARPPLSRVAPTCSCSRTSMRATSATSWCSAWRRPRRYGPILQGIAAPVNDLSRGCSADDIVGVVAITAVQAQGK